MTSWVDGATVALRPRPPAVRRLLADRRASRRVGVRHRRHRARPGRRSPAAESSTSTTSSQDAVPQRRSMAEGRQVRESARRWLDRPARRRDRARPSSRTARSPTSTLHLPFEVADYVDFYASRAPRHQRRPDLPARRRAAAAELAAPARSATTAAPAPSSRPGTPVVRPSGQRPGDGRRSAPRTRLDIEAELGFVVGVGVGARHAGPVRRVRRPRLRRRRPQRLVGARHPGVGVRAARAVPRQVVRDLDLALGDAARGARRGLGRPARPGPGTLALPGSWRHAGSRHRRRGRAQRRGRQPAAVPHDVLVPGPDARPPDRQRRLAAHRRPLRLRHDQRPRAATSAARFLEIGWGEPSRAFLDDGDEVVLRYTARHRRRRIASARSRPDRARAPDGSAGMAIEPAHARAALWSRSVLRGRGRRRWHRVQAVTAWRRA